MSGIRSYVQNSANVLTEGKVRWKYAVVDVEDDLPEQVSLEKALNVISHVLPEKFLYDLSKIRIASDPKLEKREVDAVLEGGGEILVTNEQQDEADLVGDIIHEVAHIVERQYADRIYADNEIKEEFHKKRKALSQRLEQHGYNIPSSLEKRVKYDEEVDHFLWKDVGYSELAQFGHDLFLSPYAATSLREYWADAFEDYFLKSPREVQKYASAVHKKIQELIA